MPIYTKTGDTGKSKLMDFECLEKSNPVFEVLGTLDELNSTLGFIHTTKYSELLADILAIQSTLLDLGSYIAGRPVTEEVMAKYEAVIKGLEQKIDEYEKKNPKLTAFILPGGCYEASVLHQARTITRRGERVFVLFMTNAKRENLLFIEKYLNRLSDFLFVLARYANTLAKTKEQTWKPIN